MYNDYDDDPRVEPVRDIVERLNPPRMYAGDWPRDMAKRILKAIDEVENASQI